MRFSALHFPHSSIPHEDSIQPVRMETLGYPVVYVPFVPQGQPTGFITPSADYALELLLYPSFEQKNNSAVRAHLFSRIGAFNSDRIKDIQEGLQQLEAQQRR